MARGKVRFDASPKNWEIWRNGVKKSYSTPWTFDLNEGTYTYVFKKDGFWNVSKTFAIVPNEKIFVSWEGEAIGGPPPIPPLPPKPPPPTPSPAPPMPPEHIFDVFKAWEYFPDGNRVLQYFPNKDKWGVYHHQNPDLSNMYVDPNQWTRVLLLSGGNRFTFTPEEEPPTPPEPEPQDEFTTGLTDLMRALNLDVPQFLLDFDAFMGWATETFGTEMPALQRNAITGKLEKAPVGKKILFFVSMTAPIQAAQPALTGAISNMTAGEIKALARTSPTAMQTAWKAISQADKLKLHTLLQKTALGREASDAIFAITGPTLQKAGITNLTSTLTKIWKPLAFIGGIVGLKEAVSWFHKELPEVVGFPLRDLLRDGEYKRAAELLPAYEKLVGIAVNFLRSTGFEAFLGFPIWQGYAAGYEATLQTWKDEIAAGLLVEETGTIGITTTPTGASIMIDGKLFTYPSNTVIDKLIPGNYKITLDLEEHVTYEDTFPVEAGMQTEVKHEFDPIPSEPTPGSGQLQVAVYDYKTSQAITGTLFIKGIAEKYHLHSYALDIEPGTYEIRVEEIGYEVWEDTIAITADEVTKIRAELVKIAEIPPEPPEPDNGLPPEPPAPTEKGKLTVNANVKADIFIGGVETGQKTPSILELTQGIYSIKLKAEGYNDRSTTSLVKSGEAATVFLELFKEDAPPVTTLLARVSVNSTPTGAKILVNGVWTDKYTPDSILLKAGQYEIGLTKSGYEAWNTPLHLVEES